MDFNVAFHSFPISDFADMFSIRVVAAQHGEYLAEELNLDV